MPDGFEAIIRGKKWFPFVPPKAAFRQAAGLEAAAGAAGAQIIAPELFFEKLVAVDDPHAPFHVRFRRKAAATLAHRLEKKGCSEKSAADMRHLLTEKKVRRR